MRQKVESFRLCIVTVKNMEDLYDNFIFSVLNYLLRVHDFVREVVRVDLKLPITFHCAIEIRLKLKIQKASDCRLRPINLAFLREKDFRLLILSYEWRPNLLYNRQSFSNLFFFLALSLIIDHHIFQFRGVFFRLPLIINKRR